MCRNNIFISLLLIISIYFILVKTILCEYIFEGFENKEQLPKPAKFEYAGEEITYNTDPSDKNYYYINHVNGKLDIPYSKVLTNKSLYIYEPGAISVPVIDEDSYSSIVVGRQSEYYSDNYKNRYNTEKEEYFT